MVQHIIGALHAFQTLAHVFAVIFAKLLIPKIIELRSHKHPLIALHIGRLAEPQRVDVVRIPPRIIYPVGPFLDYIVLQIMLVDKTQPTLLREEGELLQTAPVPLVPAVQIVTAQPVAGLHKPTSGKRLFIEWSPDIGIGASHPSVIVPSALVPQGRVVRKACVAFQLYPQTVQIVGVSAAFPSRYKAGQVHFGRIYVRTSEAPSPQRGTGAASCQIVPIHGNSSVHDAYRMTWFCGDLLLLLDFIQGQDHGGIFHQRLPYL